MLRPAVVLECNDCGPAAGAAYRPQTCCEFSCCQGLRVHDRGTNPCAQARFTNLGGQVLATGRRSLSPGGWTCGIVFDGRSDSCGDSTPDPCDEATSPRASPWKSSRSVTYAC